MYSPSLRFSHRLIDKNNNNNKSKHNKPNKPKKMPFPLPSQFPPNGQNQGNDDDDDDDHQQSPFQFPKLFGRDTSFDVYTSKNHIYFKTDITKESIDKLVGEIDILNNKMTNVSKKSSIGTFTPKPIYLHITTNGGDLLAGFFGYDKIKGSKYPINTIIEGCVASAGSILAMAGQNRYMTPSSHLLIHQLRTGMFGTYEELVDEKKNCNQFMSKLINLYKDNSNGKMTKTKIKEILKRDIFWDTKTAIVNGLVDEVWNGSLE